MGRARGLVHAVARRAVRGAPTELREVALALAARASQGPAVLPGPPPGPVLAVAAHPDDETIGAGGALARHAERGDAVAVVVATSGERTRAGGPQVAAARERECREACAVLGLGPPELLRLPDGELARAVEPLAAACTSHGAQARTIYAPALLDPHPDHLAVNRALAAARLPAEVYGYEVWSPAPVDVLLDITAVAARKDAALACYRTALTQVDYRRAAQGLGAYRSIAGGLGGDGFAEGFVRLGQADHAELTAAVVRTLLAEPGGGQRGR